MATAKTKSETTRRKSQQTGKTGKTPAKKKSRVLDLGKYLDGVKIGNIEIEDVLEGANKNMEAIAEANRAVIDGYTDIAKRQYEMLKELLEELRKVSGTRSEIVKDLKKVVEQAKKDLKVLQTMASKTNSQAQRIVKKRTDANTKAWRKLLEDSKKAISGKAPASKKAAPKKKAGAKTKTATKTKASPKRKTVARRKAAPKKKV